MVSGVSILIFCALKNWFRLLRSSMGLRWVFGLGTKKNQLKNPRDFWFWTNSTIFLAIS